MRGDEDQGAGAAAGEGDEDPVSLFTLGCCCGEIVLDSLGSAPSSMRAGSFPSVLHNAAEGKPAKVSESPGAGFRFTSPASFGSSCRRTHYRATFKI